jgi:hypothetical protein
VIPINILPLKRLRDNNFIAKVDDWSATNYASLVVIIVGLFDLLKTGVCFFMSADDRKVQGKESLSSMGKISSMQ